MHSFLSVLQYSKGNASRQTNLLHLSRLLILGCATTSQDPSQFGRVVSLQHWRLSQRYEGRTFGGRYGVAHGAPQMDTSGKLQGQPSDKY